MKAGNVQMIQSPYSSTRGISDSLAPNRVKTGTLKRTVSGHTIAVRRSTRTSEAV